MATTKKASKRVSESEAAYSAHGMKAPKPGKAAEGKVQATELAPHKGKKPEQGSKSIDQASKETASMEIGRTVGKSGKGKDSRAVSAEQKQPLDVKGPNEGTSLEPKFNKGKC